MISIGYRKSFLQIDVILYLENKSLSTDSTRLIIERAERDKDASEQQLNKNVRNHQSLVKVIGNLVLLNANRFLFQCQVHGNVYKKLQ